MKLNRSVYIWPSGLCIISVIYLLQYDYIRRTDLLTENTDGTVKTRADGRVKTSVDGRVKTSVDGRVKTSVDGRVKTSVDGRVKTSVDGRVKTSVDGRVKTIQWYDAYNGGSGLRGKGKFVKFSQCPVTNCVLLPFVFVNTSNDIVQKSNLRRGQVIVSPGQGPLKADAVVFHYVHMRTMEQMPKREHGQIFIMAEREPIGVSKRQIGKMDPVITSMFNWTMTFRRDSDIPLLYGRIEKRPADSIVPKNLYSTFTRKTNDIVWLVSNCDAKSRRYEYVMELRKHINVDIYGACGTFTCPGEHHNLNDTMACIRQLAPKYRFYLSFENDFKTDYVTEKFFEWFNHDIVQVTMGGADYSKVAPDGSYINIADYESPKALADYLNTLTANQKKYTEILKIKRQYYAETFYQQQQRAYCQLCEMLNNKEKHAKTYDNIHSWWDDGKREDALQYM